MRRLDSRISTLEAQRRTTAPRPLRWVLCYPDGPAATLYTEPEGSPDRRPYTPGELEGATQVHVHFMKGRTDDPHE